MNPEIKALIAKYAAANDFDPALIEAQIQQESSFNAGLVQPGTGALGLMQLMPSSFPAWTEAQLLDPETNIRIGTEFLSECVKMFKNENGDERIKFGLAAYNAGARNIIVAQQRAAAEHYPQDKWATVGVALAYVTGLSNALQTNWYVHIIMSNWRGTGV